MGRSKSIQTTKERITLLEDILIDHTSDLIINLNKGDYDAMLTYAIAIAKTDAMIKELSWMVGDNID